MKRKQNIPSPAQLLAKAKTLPRGVVLGDYLAVMWTLKKEKGLSLREIAAWLSTELHTPITHMQVYRAMEGSLPTPDMLSNAEDVEAAETKRAELNEEANK